MIINICFKCKKIRSVEEEGRERETASMQNEWEKKVPYRVCWGGW